jgi:hypothetical protein
MAKTTKGSSAAKKNKGSSARKLAVKRETLRDLAPAGRAPKGGAMGKPLSGKVEGQTYWSC